MSADESAVEAFREPRIREQGASVGRNYDELTEFSVLRVEILCNDVDGVFGDSNSVAIGAFFTVAK
jgi:hypothetical protein